MRDALDAFTADWAAHGEREERRLAYVAVTRPKQLLLCSGFWWSEGNVNAQGPSVFLTEIALGVRRGRRRGRAMGAAAGRRRGESDKCRGRPRRLAARSARARRRDAIAAAADQVRASPADWSVENIEHPVVRAEAERWSYEVNLLLAERARNQRAPGAAMEVALPGQLSVSQLVELRDDPGALAARLRRPMPVRPDPQSRRGTAFHRWLEQRFGSQQLLDLDELPGAGDEGAADDAALAELQARVPSRCLGRPRTDRGRGPVRDHGRRRRDPGPDGRRVRRRRTARST